MPWPETIDNVTIECDSNAGEFSDWDKLPQPWKDKLTESVRTAPKMVVDAIAALNNHSAQRLAHRRRVAGGPGEPEALRKRAVSNLTNPQAEVDPAQTNLDHTEVGKGLLKYFNLTSANAQYWRYINGIRATFIIVLENLKQPYKLILSNMEDVGRVWGRPDSLHPVLVSPIRQRFGFRGQWDHKYYFPLTQEDIEISPVWVRDAPSAREVARTIVHEASHKWAFTTDVLYKHQSFAEIVSLRGVRKHPLTAMHPSQMRIRMPGQPRFSLFLPMMGFEAKVDPDDDDEADVLIPTERFLENADSYAWFARRMFKRRSGIL
jgi:hypothetical protein